MTFAVVISLQTFEVVDSRIITHSLNQSVALERMFHCLSFIILKISPRFFSGQRGVISSCIFDITGLSDLSILLYTVHDIFYQTIL